MMNQTTFNTLKAQGYSYIPLVFELLADFDTPLSLYLKLANAPLSYLLESAVHEERFGRYSFIGLPCDSYLTVRDEVIKIYEGHRCIQQHRGNALNFIDSFFESFKIPEIPGFECFSGGLVGYLGYETIRYIEERLTPNIQAIGLDIPDIFLLVSKEVVIVDNFAGKLYLVIYAKSDDVNAYAKAKDKLNKIRQQLRQPLNIPLSLGLVKSGWEYEVSEDIFKEGVKRIVDYIRAGDCMQVVLSRKIFYDYKTEPISLYRALRTINPSPFLIFYHFRDFVVVGSSPEVLLRKVKERLIVRPLAGTRKRGIDAQEDLLYSQELLSDEKERAEHTMLIDLGRNDLGRVSKPGTVKITRKMAIERYSHVMHIVSEVESEIRPEVSPMQAFAAVFPAGTLSGAPKIRAMEILQELEPSRRGVYGGALGYLSFSGDMDWAIGIRTAVIKDQKAVIQVGAGIVADSHPKTELEETTNKAMALIKALKLVEHGLDGEID